MGPLPAIRRLCQRDHDRIEDPFEFRHHIVVRYPQHAEAQPRQHIVAQPVLGFIMRIAIDFDDQRLLRADEVGNVAADDGLTTEFVAVRLAVGQRAPETFLGFGRVTAHFSGALLQRR